MPSMKSDLNLSDFVSGLCVSAVVITLSIVGPFIGELQKKVANKTIITASFLFWLVSIILISLSSSGPQLVASRAFLGIFQGIFCVVSTQIVDQIVPSEKKSVAFAIFYLMIYLAAGVSYGVGGILVSTLKWNQIFLIFGLLAFPLIIFSRMLQGGANSGHTASAQKEMESKKVWSDIFELLFKNPVYLLVSVAGAIWTFVVPAFSAWAPTYIERVLKIPSAQGGIILGALTIVGGIGGTMVGGIVSDFFSEKRKGSPIWVCSISTLPAALFLFLCMRIDVPILFWIAVGLTLFFVSISVGPINTSIMNSVKAHQRATAFGLSLFIGHFLGDIWSPSIVGYLSDRIGLREALTTLPVLLVFASLTWMFAAFKYEKKVH